MRSKVRSGHGGQRSGSDCRTDHVPKGEKLKPKWDMLLGRRDKTSKREVEGASWGGGGGAPFHE